MSQQSSDNPTVHLLLEPPQALHLFLLNILFQLSLHINISLRLKFEKV